jgi:hypothetical protein
MFVTFGKRGNGRFVIAINAIVAINDRLDDGSEVLWAVGNELRQTTIGISAEEALKLIEFECEKARRATLIDGGRAVKP